MELNLIILAMICYCMGMIISEKKRKELIQDYEQLLLLKDWYEKIPEEANRSYILERVEKRGRRLIDQLNLLNANLVKIQEDHEKLQQQQKKLHNKLLEEHKLLNENFQNYS